MLDWLRKAYDPVLKYCDKTLEAAARGSEKVAGALQGERQSLIPMLAGNNPDSVTSYLALTADLRYELTLQEYITEIKKSVRRKG